MISIAPINSATKASTDNPVILPPGSKQALGQDDFLKLLAVQFQSQDPMKPMDDTAFIAQMAQFSSLTQTQTLTQQMTQLRANQDLATANSYIGRQVTVNAGDGTTVIGNVTAVDASGSSPQVIVNGSPYALSAVLRLEPGVVPAPAG
ncbi:MAG: flagellar basal body rod modification protein [Verrucomicrobia bacterium]|nr:flagellar basal body rod modification protein [Verrucomicrobiota bacterium]